MKLQETINKIEKEIEGIGTRMEKPFSDVIEFIKKHRKTILIIGFIYFICRYLFEEESA